MNWTKLRSYFRVDVAIFVIILIMFTSVLLQILYRLMSALPWRVNCWFCNSNTWVKYPEHNNWTCPKCDQYNGFTKDGDYNKAIITTNDQVQLTPKLFQKSPPRNGLCKMCNINQQLKVTQLANYMPVNEKYFDEEIEEYRMKLEKAYKLCSPCRNVLQLKLHKEKEFLLSTKLLENRSPEKKEQLHKEQQSKALRELINNTSMLISALLLMLVSYEFYNEKMEYKNLPETISNLIEIVKGLVDRLSSIIRMKIFTTFPSAEGYYNEIHSEQYIHLLPKHVHFRIEWLEHVNMTCQRALGAAACLLQGAASIWNVNPLRYTLAVHLLWAVFLISTLERIVTLNPLLTIVIKMTSVLMLLLVYRNTNRSNGNGPERRTSPIPVAMAEASPREEDSESDVSLCKFGLRGLADSSGGSGTPSSESLWSGPCAHCDSVFVKPTFRRYRGLARDDSDSELDESIGSLSLGGGPPPPPPRVDLHSVFSMRGCAASPRRRAARPLLSPGRLSASASWVAGGYWGGEPAPLRAHGSRSSSQSSGFESQGSGLTATNPFSVPASVWGEPPPHPFRLAPAPLPFGRVFSPAPPAPRYGGYVLPPLATFSRPPASGIIKLPRVDSFASH